MIIITILLYKGADTHSTSKLLVAIIKMCFETKNWSSLNENLVLLTKRRGQIKQVRMPVSVVIILHTCRLFVIVAITQADSLCLEFIIDFFNCIVFTLQSVTKMVQEACTYVEKTPNLDIKLKLIDTLRTITAGKVKKILLLLSVIQKYA